VATVAAIRRVAGSDLALTVKWPNDILAGDAKLVGILAESTIESDRSVLAAIGIGINLAHAPEGLGRETTCLSRLGANTGPWAMLDALAAELALALQQWELGRGFAVIRSRWLADATPIGTPMSVHAGRDVVLGTFAGMDDDGALILRDHSGYEQRMTFGDVTLSPYKMPPRAVEDQI